MAGQWSQKVQGFQSQGFSSATKRDALAGYVLVENIMHIGVWVKYSK